MEFMQIYDIFYANPIHVTMLPMNNTCDPYTRDDVVNAWHVVCNARRYMLLWVVYVLINNNNIFA